MKNTGFSRSLILGVMLSAAAAAQTTNTGGIDGTITDASGAVLPNVKVTITSPALQGEQTFNTTDQGLYRFLNLPIGVYKITYEAQGFATQVREGIDVRINFTNTLNVQMGLATQQQSVVVTAETPLVDTENVQVLGGFNNQQLKDIPNGRDMWSIIGLTPGMTNQTLDVGGSAVGNQVTYTAYGFTGSQNRVIVDGVNSTEGTSSAGGYYDYGSFQEFTIGTAANDASMPVPGNQVNAVIKTGGNQFHGEYYQDYENPSFQGHNINAAQELQGAGVGQRITAYHDSNGNIGGPIKRDRVWFFVALRDQVANRAVVNFPVQAPGTIPSETKNLNITEKVSGQITPNHRLSQFIAYNPEYKPQRNSAAGDYHDYMQYQQDNPWWGNVQYNGIITPKFFVNVILGTWGYNFPLRGYGAFAGDPGTPGCPCAQNLPPVAIGQVAPLMQELNSSNLAGTIAQTRTSPRRYQLEPSGSYFLDNFLHASHQLKFGFVYERQWAQNETDGSLNDLTEIFKSTGLPDFSTPYQVKITNATNVVRSYNAHYGAYLTDQVKVLKRVTLNIGARWDYYNETYLPSQLRPDCLFCDYFYRGIPLPNGASLPATPFANGTFPGGTVGRFPLLISPRIGIAWDLFGNGRTMLKLNWGQYYYQLGTNVAAAVSPVQTETATFAWNNPNNLAFNLNQLGAISGQPTLGQGAFVQPHLQDPRLDDMGAIVEHQLTHTLLIRGGFIFRTLHHDTETINLSLPSNLYTIPVQEKIPGLNYGINGNTTDYRTVTLWDVPKNEIPAVSQNEYASPTGSNQVYRNLEFTVVKRLSQRFTATANYYWTKTTANIASLSSTGVVTTGIATNPDALYNSHESFTNWTSHVDGTYQAPWGLMISPVLRMQSGTPLGRVVPVTGLNIGTQYVMADPVGTYRSDNMFIFDTRVEKDLKLWNEKIQVGLFFDAFNILNSNGENTVSDVTSVKTTTVNISNPDAPKVPNLGPNSSVQYQGFTSPTLILAPRIFRIGARFSF